MKSEPASFWIELLPEQSTSVVHAYGDIDRTTARTFESVMLQAVEGSDDSFDVVIDMTGVTFADTTILDVLAPWSVHLRDRDRTLRIVGAAPVVHRLINAFDLQDVLITLAAPDGQSTASSPEQPEVSDPPSLDPMYAPGT